MLTRRRRELPAALSSTLVEGTKPTDPSKLVSTGPEAALPHGPFDNLLPDSVPRPKHITGESLQELMLLREHSSAWHMMRVSER